MSQLFGPVHFGFGDEPGILRRGSKRFSYIDERTKRAPSERDMERIRALAVPPAWSNVWIAADVGSHVQAWGRDARGRKQYRYHPAFTETRAENKFDDLISFAQVLGSLRSRVTRDLGRDELSHDRVVATVVRLLDVTSLRVGNVEYARTKRAVNAVIDQVADHLGNTRSICRKSYVHPAVVDAYLDVSHWRRPVGRRPAGLLDSERRTLRLLRKRSG